MPKVSCEVHILGYFNWLLRIIKFCIRSFFVVHMSVLLAVKMILLPTQNVFVFYVE